MYEMVTGTRPFVGDSALSVAVQRLTQAPTSPRARVPDLDPRWEQAILRCLERDPARRFTSAGNVSRALSETHPLESSNQQPKRRYGRLLSMTAGIALALVLLFKTFSSPALAVSSIAVVPFGSEGLDRETEYLTDGVTEGVIDSLSQLPQPALKVIALTSVMRYKGREIDAKAIGRELKVGAVVIGKVVQRSDRLAISAELVNATDQSRMWGKTYTVGLLELPKLQQDIAEGISEHLGLPSAIDHKTTGVAKRYPDNVDAYRLYLKGRYFWNQYTEEGWKKAIDYFNQAIEIDPNYALAWAGLADTYYQMSSIVMLPVEAIPRARAAAIRALAIDDGVAEAHASLGIIKAQYDWDSKGAEKEFKRALELNSNYATAHQWYGMFLYADTQFEAAKVELDKAHELDPFSMIVAVTTIWPLRHLGQDDFALKQLEKIIEMFPNFPDLVDYAHDIRGEAYLQKGMHQQAVAELLHGYRIKVLCGDNPDAIDSVKRAYAESGLDGYWRKQLELGTRRYEQELETARKQSPERYVSPYHLAELNARIGEKERALALLQESYKNRDERVRWLKAESVSADSPWKSIRQDPRFSAILRGVGLGG
jgi:TolB-like protein/Tfp pilus assembly protein PilF